MLIRGIFAILGANKSAKKGHECTSFLHTKGLKNLRAKKGDFFAGGENF